MDEIITYLRDFNIVTVTLRIALAMLIGGIIGIERSKHGRAAGMRTHILVCLGATLAAMIGFYSAKVLGLSGDPLRIAAQVISGIGFLGVGTILIKGRFQITGLTTAAGVWTVAAIGLALGAGFYEGALITSVCAILTVTVIPHLEFMLNKRYSRFGVYMEIRSDSEIRKTIDFLEENFHASDIQVTAPRSGKAGNVGLEVNIYNKDFVTSPKDISKILEEQEQIVFALESI